MWGGGVGCYKDQSNKSTPLDSIMFLHFSLMKTRSGVKSYYIRLLPIHLLHFNLINILNICYVPDSIRPWRIKGMKHDPASRSSHLRRGSICV